MCKSCQRELRPVKGSEQCSACEGWSGVGQCFQFDCSSCKQRGSPASVRSYCGSHPFFSGYPPADQLAGDQGPALWEEAIDVYDDCFEISMAAAASQILVFPGWDCQDRDGLLMRCARALVLFPTCQVRVVRFYVSCPASGSSSSSASAGPQLQALDRSVPRRTRTESSGSE